MDQYRNYNVIKAEEIVNCEHAGLKKKAVFDLADGTQLTIADEILRHGTPVEGDFLVQLNKDTYVWRKRNEFLACHSQVEKFDLEAEIERRGLDAPRVTEEDVLGAIRDEQYWQFPDTTVTICCLILHNGFTMVGQSACISPANFNEDIGRKLAREDAVHKLWAFEGYRKLLEITGTVVAGVITEPPVEEIIGDFSERTEPEQEEIDDDASEVSTVNED